MDKKLYFRAFEYEDLSFINELRNNNEFFDLTCGNRYFISSEWDKKWIEDKIFNNQNQLYLIICKSDGCPIGYICVTGIDYINRKAVFGGLVIKQEFSGNGYGTEASILLLEHLFGELGMNMVYAYVREDHIASLRMCEKAGYRKDCLVRDFVYKQNKFHNAYLCSILKSDFDERMKDLN